MGLSKGMHQTPLCAKEVKLEPCNRQARQPNLLGSIFGHVMHSEGETRGPTPAAFQQLRYDTCSDEEEVSQKAMFPVDV